MAVITQNSEDTSELSISRVLLASTFGTIIEWYDFFIYGTAAATVFGKLFFPSADSVVSTLAAFSVFAVGYIARPIGGVIFGHYGDRIGRRSMLVISILMMGVGTFLVGCLPTYDQIGIWAPVLLIALRLIQAIGLGGEWGGAVLMVAETAPPARRGLYGSIVQMGNPIGRLVATGVFALASGMPASAFLSWGWRVPFLASALLVIVGVFIRTRLEETPAFERMRAAKLTAKKPLWEVLSAHRRATVIAIGLKVTEVAWVNVLSVFAVAYLTKQLGMSTTFILSSVTAATFVELIVMPLSGWLSDRVGRRPLYLFGTIFGAIFAFPLFWMMQTRDPVLVFTAIVVGISVCQGVVFALHASFMPELFGTKVRYSGISLGFQIGAAIGGGITPLLAAAVTGWANGATWPISTFMVILSIVTVIAVLSSQEKSGESIST
jgi:MFS transporter, MHS family, shikimate and dehydroshikimate transport protein